MISTPTVRYILLAVFVLFSGKTECLSDNVKNDAGVWEATAVNTKYESLTPILKGNGGDWQNDVKAGNVNFEKLNSNEAQDDFRDNNKKKCWTSLCALLQKHRVIRQTNTGQTSLYPHLPTSYPYQPPNNAYPYNSNNQQPNSFSNATNPYYPYSTYPQPNGSASPSYQSQPTNPPYHNNYTNNFNPSYSPNVRHTYPPSPKPNFNRPYESNTGNSSYFYHPTHNPYSNNSTYRPTQFYSNASNSNYPNSFQNHGSAYPPFNQRPPVNPTSGYKANYTNYYGANNSTPLNNSFNQRTPYYNLVNASYASYPNNNNQGSTYSPNRPYTNNSEPNHYNPHGYYPTSDKHTHLNASGYLVNPFLNRPTTYNGTNVTSYPYYQPASNKNPSPYNANIPQYNPYSEPNNFNTHFNTSGNIVNPFLNRPTTYNGTNVTTYPYYQPASNKTPSPYNANIPQYNPSPEPNNFYAPYNNGPQYDPHKNALQHFSYPPY